MSAAPPSSPQTPPGVPPMTWMQRISSVLFVMLTLELGLFLLIYPWMDSWERNYLLLLRPEWSEFFLSSQFRGALSGLGVLYPVDIPSQCRSNVRVGGVGQCLLEHGQGEVMLAQFGVGDG